MVGRNGSKRFRLVVFSSKNVACEASLDHKAWISSNRLLKGDVDTLMTPVVVPCLSCQQHKISMVMDESVP